MTPIQVKDNKGNAIAAGATALYAVLWLLLALFLTFDPGSEIVSGEGILINFGNSETGWGDEDLPTNDRFANAAAASQSATVSSQQDVLTSDRDDTPAIAPARRPTTQYPTPSTHPTNRPSPTPPVEQPRQVNQNALFPGRGGGNAASEGVTGGAGNQGNLAGDPAGSHSGAGLGTSGISYDLNGRSIVGVLPKPDYSEREEGRVVVEIRVDQQGDVVNAAYRSVGSTTANSKLVAAALLAARQAKFNTDPSAPFPQVGTIIYNYRMN
ncbi:MAG: TonB family protein [Rikenellaceae bacterium]|jgi:TonB family protein|nr:TonB family protein [Rikenellaceae bacterium]